MQPFKTIDLGFSAIEIHEHFAISTIAEGVTLTNEKLSKMFEVFSLYYKDRPFVSIANRKNDYTVDPNLLSFREHPELIALAVVCHTKASKHTSIFEQQFFNGTYEIFERMDEAKVWSTIFLEAYLKKAGL
jgi:hypothetical protein